MAFLPLIIWLLLVSGASQTVRSFYPHLSDWKQVFADHVIFALASIFSIAMVLAIAGKTFARRLKGFGLNIRTLPADLWAALVNLLSIYPVIWAVVVLTMFAGQLIRPDFQMQPHKELETLIAHSQLSLRTLIFVTTILLIPICEEVIFRGLLQTVIRSYVKRPWLSIALASVIFTAAHYDPTHWPALFVLSMCIGYSYEKSGSILRPICIHALFNAVSIIGSLYQ